MFTVHHCCCLEHLQHSCEVLLKGLRIVIEQSLFEWLFRFFLEVQLNKLRVSSLHERLLRCLKIRVQVRDQVLVIGEKLLRCLKILVLVRDQVLGIGERFLRCLRILVQVRDQILVIDKRLLRCVKILAQVADWILRIMVGDLVIQICDLLVHFLEQI